MLAQYIVKNEYDCKTDYGIKIRKQYAKCLSNLKKGQSVNPFSFAQQHKNEFTRKHSVKSHKAVVYHSFSIGKKIGLLRLATKEELGIPITFKEFCKLESVAYFIDQLSKTDYKNLKAKELTGTAEKYSYELWYFNNWLYGKSIEILFDISTGKSTFKRQRKKIKLDGVEDLLELYQRPHGLDVEFVKLCKKYLLDPIHQKKKANTIKIAYNAIKSYFDKNDSPLEFRFDYKAKYKSNSAEDDQPIMSLKDLLDLLTVGQPTLVQKAVFLCKFHRGLDTSTLVDRFNFQVWEQLVDYFGTEDYERWDLTKCPAPIRLTRLKTGFTHTSYLDIDAIDAIREYLRFRRKQTLRDMKNGEALFLNQQRKPIRGEWIRSSLKKLRKNAGLDKKLSGYKQTRYKIDSHELRDLLKSTLIECHVRIDLADYLIAHKPESYEKQADIFHQTVRKEYMKASKMLNIFSNISNYMNGENGPKLPIKCNICQMVNPVDSTVCSQCGKPLDLQTALEEDERRKEWNSKIEKKLAATTETLRDVLESFVEYPRLIGGNGKVHPTEKEMQEHRRMNEALLKKLKVESYD